MTYTPEHLETWTPDGPTAFDSARNYAGADLSGFYLAPVSITRDSRLLESVNWEVVTRDLQKAAAHDETGPTTMGHWACGWYEIFLIHASDEPALRAADEWACALSDYPVADEMLWSEREWEAVAEHWEQCSIRDRLDLIEGSDVSPFAARRDEMPSEDNGYIYERISSEL